LETEPKIKSSLTKKSLKMSSKDEPGMGNSDLIHVEVEGVSESKKSPIRLIQPSFQVTVSRKPSMQSIQEAISEVIVDDSNTCVLKTDKDINGKIKKIIKQKILNENPYKKNQAIDFWRRQRIQFKA